MEVLGYMLKKRAKTLLVLLLFITMSPSLTPTGAGAVSCGATITSDTVLTADLLNCGGLGIAVGANSVTLNCQGHVISGTPPNPFYQGTGVRLAYRQNVTVENCEVRSFWYGFELSNSSENILLRNTSHDNFSGFCVHNGSSLNLLHHNTARNNNGAGSCGGGISLENASSNNITSNLAYYNSGTGVVLSGGSSNLLSYNIAYGNQVGLTVSGTGSIATSNVAYGNGSSTGSYGILLIGAKNCTVEGNDVHDNLNGVFVGSGSVNNTMSRNRVYKNKIGFFIGGSFHTFSSNLVYANTEDGFRIVYSNSTTIFSNYVVNNAFGIESIGNNAQNLVYNNRFSNTVNAVDRFSTDLWNVTKRPGPNIVGGPFVAGNYFSDYQGKDLDGDGLGDSLLPYNSGGRIVYGGDFRPLVSNLTSDTGPFKLDWADYDNNGKVEILDLAQAASVFGQMNGYWDPNLDGKVDIIDIATVALYYDQSFNGTPYPGEGFPLGSIDPMWKAYCGSFSDPIGSYCGFYT